MHLLGKVLICSTLNGEEQAECAIIMCLIQKNSLVQNPFSLDCAKLCWLFQWETISGTWKGGLSALGFTFGDQRLFFPPRCPVCKCNPAPPQWEGLRRDFASQTPEMCSERSAQCVRIPVGVSVLGRLSPLTIRSLVNGGSGHVSRQKFTGGLS